MIRAGVGFGSGTETSSMTDYISELIAKQAQPSGEAVKISSNY